MIQAKYKFEIRLGSLAFAILIIAFQSFSAEAAVSCITPPQREMLQKRLEQFAPFQHEQLAKQLIAAFNAVEVARTEYQRCHSEASVLGEALGVCNKADSSLEYEQQKYELVSSKIETAKTFRPSITELQRLLAFPSCD